MVSEDHQLDRRTVLKASSIGIAGLFTTGVTSARPSEGQVTSRGGKGERGPPTHSNAPDWVRAKNGRLTLTIDKAEWNRVDPSDVDGVPNKARVIPFEVMENVVSDFNKEVEDGDLSLGKNGEIHVHNARDAEAEENGGKE